jgi:hypothetical protein
MADQGVEDYRGLRGAQKAAIVMLALGEEQCGRLFSMMHEDEIRDMSGQNRLWTKDIGKSRACLPYSPATAGFLCQSAHFEADARMPDRAEAVQHDLVESFRQVRRVLAGYDSGFNGIEVNHSRKCYLKSVGQFPRLPN